MSNRQAGNPPPTNDVVFPTLKESIRANRCVAVIGAGVSAGDYPIWTHLINQLQERCGVRAEDIPSTNPLDVAQAAKDKNASAYFERLTKHSTAGRPRHRRRDTICSRGSNSLAT